MTRFLCALVFVFHVGTIWGNTQIMVHVTRPGGGFETLLIFANQDSSQSNEIRLLAFGTSQLPITVPLTLAAGENQYHTVTELFGTADVEFFLVDASEKVQVLAQYQAQTGHASPVQVGSQYRQSANWQLYPGNWEVAWDGLAIVNLNGLSAHVQCKQLDAFGTVLNERVLFEDLSPMQKGLCVVDALFPFVANSHFVIESDQSVAVLGLRGTRNSTAPSILWENEVVPLDAEASASVVPTTPGLHVCTFPFEHNLRRYYLQIPEDYDPKIPTPVVFYFHGGGGSYVGVRTSGWLTAAQEAGWIVVAPDGTPSFGSNSLGHTWNGPHCCGAALVRHIDEPSFLRALLGQLMVSLNLDRRAVFASGFSNGGMSTHVLASELPSLLAAVSVAGTTIGGAPHDGQPIVTIAPPAEPVPILMMHGMLDTNVNYFGGSGEMGGDRYDISFAESTEFWVTANGCLGPPKDEVTSYGSMQTYDSCGPRGTVIAVTIDAMGHQYPKADNGFDGARESIAFFQQFARKFGGNVGN